MVSPEEAEFLVVFGKGFRGHWGTMIWLEPTVINHDIRLIGVLVSSAAFEFLFPRKGQILCRGLTRCSVNIGTGILGSTVFYGHCRLRAQETFWELWHIPCWFRRLQDHACGGWLVPST